MEKDKVMEYFIIPMDLNMRESGKKISNMEKLFLTMKLEKHLNYFSKMINYCQKSKFNQQTKRKFTHK
jgi:hypothetical protein